MNGRSPQSGEVESEEAIYRRVLKRKIEEGRRQSGNRGGRPKKAIDFEKVIERFNRGIPLTEIAATQHVAVSTLHRRLKEAGITLEKKLKNEETSELAEIAKIVVKMKPEENKKLLEELLTWRDEKI